MEKAVPRVFRLSNKVLKAAKNIEPKFGYGALSKIVYLRTYSRVRDYETGLREDWTDTVQRVTEGCMDMQYQHFEKNGIHWDSSQKSAEALQLFQKINEFKMSPPGRGLWGMGGAAVRQKGLNASLNNCGFISTFDMSKKVDENREPNPAYPFAYMVEMSMLGVGVGFDSLGGELNIPIHRPWHSKKNILIDDSREGWTESVRVLINSYLVPNQQTMVFDYSQLRPKGAPLKIFGGTSSGPAPLAELHDTIRDVFNSNLEITKRPTLTKRIITDIMNLCGRCVVAGGIRRYVF